MHFQLKVDYYSNEANKNKYTNFQLKASIKIAEVRLYRALNLQRELAILCCFGLKVLCCLDLLLLESIVFMFNLCFFEQGKCHPIFISVRYT